MTEKGSGGGRDEKKRIVGEDYMERGGWDAPYTGKMSLWGNFFLIFVSAA